jgi:hypothetical protein
LRIGLPSLLKGSIDEFNPAVAVGDDDGIGNAFERRRKLAHHHDQAACSIGEAFWLAANRIGITNDCSCMR